MHDKLSVTNDGYIILSRSVHINEFPVPLILKVSDLSLEELCYYWIPLGSANDGDGCDRHLTPKDWWFKRGKIAKAVSQLIQRPQAYVVHIQKHSSLLLQDMKLNYILSHGEIRE